MKTKEAILNALTADRKATFAWRDALRADCQTIADIYAETVTSTPSETIATAAAKIGIDRVRVIIASLVASRQYDGRISRESRAWAETIADALDAEAAQWAWLSCDSIHSAHLDQLACAARDYVAPETPAETAQDAQETTETETAPETHETAESPAETAERAAEEAKPINPMCAECVKRGATCPGTTCQDYTGCVRRETLVTVDSPSERSKTPARITTAPTARLLVFWDYARRLSYCAATAQTRRWILDELERRDPAGFARWLDSDDDSDYDATLRDYIHPDDDHVKGIKPYLTGWRV